MRLSQSRSLIKAQDLLGSEFWFGIMSVFRNLDFYVDPFWLTCDPSKYNILSLTPELMFSDQIHSEIFVSFWIVNNILRTWTTCENDCDLTPKSWSFTFIENQNHVIHFFFISSIFKIIKYRSLYQDNDHMKIKTMWFIFFSIST